jgi:hypothetical protein
MGWAQRKSLPGPASWAVGSSPFMGTTGISRSREDGRRILERREYFRIVISIVSEAVIPQITNPSCMNNELTVDCGQMGTLVATRDAGTTSQRHFAEISSS